MAEPSSSDEASKVASPASSPSSRLHVVFVVDTTGSMGAYLEALTPALCQVFALLGVLFPSRDDADVSVLTYEDYGDGSRLLRTKVRKPYRELSDFCSGLRPGGGADLAEASKTALNYLSGMVRNWRDDSTFVFHYTDAPPHHRLTNPSGPNRPKEVRALAGKAPGYDWCDISRRFRRAAASDRVRLFTVVPEDSAACRCGAAFHALLGELVALPVVTSRAITQATMSILLCLLGQQDSTIAAKAQNVRFRRQDEVLDRLLTGEHNEETFPELNSEACNEPTFQVAVRNTADLEWLDGVIVEAVPAVAGHDLSKLQARFRRDSGFREVVFRTMSDLVNPHSVMALTTNAVFGRMWRLVCSARDDERLTDLVARMGGCASSKLLSAEERTALQAWIEESYDYAEEMNEKIKSHRACAGVYVLDAFPKDYVPCADGLRSLARAPSPVALANLQKILSHIMLVRVDSNEELPTDEDGNCRYLPQSLGDREIFTMLPHLIRPGTMYSLKPAALLAIVCCKNTSSLLGERARQFLVSIRGKWLPSVVRIDRAEILSFEFASLIANCDVEGAFTDEEREFFLRLHEIWRYRRGRFTTFEVITHASPTKPMLLPDSTERCRSCREWTSKTLLDGSKKCGICLWMSESRDNRWSRPKKHDPYFVEQNESYVVDCTACHSMYAVLGPADLNVPPKCHYCRGLDKDRRARLGAPFRRCGCCRAKWCDPSLVENDESSTFICPVCTHGGATTESPVPAISKTSHSATLQHIMDSNPHSMVKLGFREESVPILFSGRKLYQAVVDDRPVLFQRPLEGVCVTGMIHKGKAVLNEEELLKTVQESIACATFVHTCNLCFEEIAVEKFRPACGNCSSNCCQDCLKSWYGQNSPGQLFIPCHDMCPFCRQPPLFRVLNQYNPQACGIIGYSRRKGAGLRLRADCYYGWCAQCWRVGFAMERQCATDGVPSLSNFTCEECEEKKQLGLLAKKESEEERTKALLANAKPCPGCTMLTNHMGGCSHMKCANCGDHWCWQCGKYKSKNSQDVYEHMSAAHRGYGWQNEADDDDVEEEA